MALGMAKASGLPVAITCTSGTAAANLAPAVAEAREARVPLIVLTADRPPELRDVGAGQAIDQVKLYGSAAKWFVEVGNHDPSRQTAVHHRGLACRAFWTARGGRPGPVHLNLPLREPLAPSPRSWRAEDWQGRDDGRPWVELREHPPAPHADDVQGLADRMAGAPARRDRVRAATRGGGRAGGAPGRGQRLAGAGRAHLRRPLRRPRPLARGGPLRRAAARAGLRRLALRPALVLRVGDTAHVQAAARLARRRPSRSCSTRTRPGTSPPAGPSCCCTPPRPPPATPWRPRWRCARWSATPPGCAPGATPTPRCPAALAAAPDPFEPKAIAALEPALEDGALVWVSSSMPVRDVEAYFPSVAQARALPGQPRRQRDRRHRVVGRRRRARDRRADTVLITASWRCSTTSAACWPRAGRASSSACCA